VLLALADASTDEVLRDLLSRPLPYDAEHAAALAGLRSHPAMDRAREVLDSWVAKAREALVPLPDGDVKQALETLCAGIAAALSNRVLTGFWGFSVKFFLNVKGM